MELTDLTPKQKSLLLYLETCAVDYGGEVDGARFDKSHFEQAEAWNKQGFILFGRIAKKTPTQSGRGFWCALSDHAWTLAHQERHRRFKSKFAHRAWLTTGEADESLY
jgi:hypothetical protein